MVMSVQNLCLFCNSFFPPSENLREVDGRRNSWVNSFLCIASEIEPLNNWHMLNVKVTWVTEEPVPISIWERQSSPKGKRAIQERHFRDWRDRESKDFKCYGQGFSLPTPTSHQKLELHLRCCMRCVRGGSSENGYWLEKLIKIGGLWNIFQS